MRGEIRQLQQSLGITAIYVTHDQEEALAISDRIAVMRAGRLEQVGTPEAIYRDSATPFVAQFMGITNLLDGKVIGQEGARLVVEAGAAQFRIEAGTIAPGERITFSLRPEALRVIAADETPPPGWHSIEAQVARVEFLGTLTRVETRLAGGTMLRVALLDQPLDALTAGRMLRLGYDPRRVNVLDRS
jgi:ABC-type Fe3+/spermidine/putrescine transport system ATPase subunit